MQVNYYWRVGKPHRCADDGIQMNVRLLTDAMRTGRLETVFESVLTYIRYCGKYSFAKLAAESDLRNCVGAYYIDIADALYSLASSLLRWYLEPHYEIDPLLAGDYNPFPPSLNESVYQEDTDDDVPF